MMKNEENLKIKKVIECEIDNEITEKIQELLTESFQGIYPNNRIYFKQVPHFRFLVFNEDKHLLAQVGLDYRVMNLNGKLIKVLGIIDLCVSQESRAKGIASLLLLEIDKYCVGKDIDFVILFADNQTLYLKNGYKSVKNKCKWLKIDDRNQTILGIGYEEISELMIKKIGMNEWTEGDIDFLGYLY